MTAPLAGPALRASLSLLQIPFPAPEDFAATLSLLSVAHFRLVQSPVAIYVEIN